MAAAGTRARAGSISAGRRARLIYGPRSLRPVLSALDPPAAAAVVVVAEEEEEEEEETHLLRTAEMLADSRHRQAQEMEEEEEEKEARAVHASGPSWLAG